MAAFARWWLLTILLGGIFLFGTAREWDHLIFHDGLTISTNLFGTTYYSLVGLHAFHVTMGLLALMTVALFYFAAQTPARARRTPRSLIHVLALRGCRLGSCLHGGLRDRSLEEESMNNPREDRSPAPTAWPIVLAFGLTLVSAGFVTAASVSILGAVLAVAGAVGWFREVLPVESHEWVPWFRRRLVIQTPRETVERIAVSVPRAWLPVEIYPISAGIKGGLAGGVVWRCWPPSTAL